MTGPRDVTDQPAGSVSDWGSYRLDLTGPDSHVLTIQPGRGDLSLGPADGKPVDLQIGPDDAIDWSAFDPFATPAGSPWPRHIVYRGNDAGFFAWARRRPIENFSWTPDFADARDVDAAGSDIHSLFLRLGELRGSLRLTMPAVYHLSVAGDLARLRTDGALPRSLSLLPALGRATGEPVVVPDLGPLRDVESVTLSGAPLGRPISLTSLRQFTRIESLSLHGSFTDWEALGELDVLRGLEVRFVPNLDGMPSLDTWPSLERFIAFNVDEAGGKVLRSQMRARAKTRPWDDYASVVKLRKPEWWQQEYGRPFAGWAARRAKIANAAYDAALASLAAAEDLGEARAAIVAFVERFNSVPGIETTEREDVGDAVLQLQTHARSIALGVTAEDALSWFDETRDF